MDVYGGMYRKHKEKLDSVKFVKEGPLVAE